MPLLKTLQPCRVLMSADAVGGVWTYALEVARGLDARGIATHIAILGPAPDAGQMRQARSIPSLTLISTGLPLDWTADAESDLDAVATHLGEIADEIDPDVVHLNAPAHAGLFRWRRPLVVTAHSCVSTWWHALHKGPMPQELAWRAMRTLRGLLLADGVIVPSESFGRALCERYAIAKPVTVIHNGRSTPTDVSSPTGRDGVLTAGRLWDPAKNVVTIDGAAQQLGRRIVACGPVSGPNGERFKAANLQLLGNLSAPALARQYSRSRIFVSVSRYEPFGLSVLEAAQQGLALILSDIPTFRELWNGAAVFVPARDHRRLAAAIDHLSTKPAVAEALGRKAKMRAASFSVGRMLDKTIAHYLQLRPRPNGGTRANLVDAVI